MGLGCFDGDVVAAEEPRPIVTRRRFLELRVKLLTPATKTAEDMTGNHDITFKATLWSGTDD